ncbi:DUF5067 domain-containing protein [Bombilactobacillus folatiphilus]|uniref:DUF5067 domain-containing protein n=1 Tax=Bombilactobacillus folatiphilus TaxID=2923362 RepID=A0ABY4P9U2_9LACO|nr:DUF5067 domain-containing protein [Bombilactobacillus folatiphilus]UQS82387.1 DUF5067 domain-containing protein [Bombilactobacillus folatiphilus]
MPERNKRRQFQTNKQNNLNQQNPQANLNQSEQPLVQPHANSNSQQPHDQKPPYPTNQYPDYQVPPLNPKTETMESSNQPDNRGLIPPQNPPQKSKRPWYKQPLVWIIVGLVVLVIIVLGVFLLLHPSKDNASKAPTHPKTEKVSTKVPKLKKKDPAKKANSDLKKDENERQVKSETTSGDRQWKNPGSYDNMKYDTDDFTIELNNSSDGVKLISDADNKPALYVEYTFTNHTKQDLKPADIVNQDLQLKQDNQVLNANTNPGDDNNVKAKLDAAQQSVAAGQQAQVAMLYSVNNTKDQISMFFMNLKTKQPIATTQPFKL